MGGRLYIGFLGGVGSAFQGGLALVGFCGLILGLLLCRVELVCLHLEGLCPPAKVFWGAGSAGWEVLRGAGCGVSYSYALKGLQAKTTIFFIYS